MRKKIIAIVALCCFMSAPVQAASFCPYHWWIALVALGEGMVAYLPEYRREVRAAQIAATIATLGFVAKRVSDRMAAEAEKTDD